MWHPPLCLLTFLLLAGLCLALRHLDRGGGSLSLSSAGIRSTAAGCRGLPWLASDVREAGKSIRHLLSLLAIQLLVTIRLVEPKVLEVQRGFGEQFVHCAELHVRLEVVAQAEAKLPFGEGLASILAFATPTGSHVESKGGDQALWMDPAHHGAARHPALQPETILPQRQVLLAGLASRPARLGLLNVQQRRRANAQVAHGAHVGGELVNLSAS
mmetsp:Transcript_5384/g.14990  ORF Transcript_5384/g.14990 Transcript_5384/m.14990 type:complete len:214 (+) Transcript_5384:613-1254(+)